MRKLAGTDDLIERAAQVRRALVAAVLAAACALIVAVLLIEPTSGIADVHVPEGTLSLFAHPGGLPAGEPYIVGRGWGRLPQLLGTLIHLVTFGAWGVAIWALVKRHKPLAMIAVAWVVTVRIAGPMTATMQPTPPVAVSTSVARAVIAANVGWRDGMEEDQQWVRYIKAQIAYIDGDRAAAAGLSAGLDKNDIELPDEMRYRLQYLQGGPITMSSACFETGCLSPMTRAASQLVAITGLAVATAFAITFAALLRLLKGRVARIEELSARGRRARLTA